jgi:carboxymethylenebutenolidase
MCYDSNAHPPEIPGFEGIGGGGTGQELTLTATDGNQFAAFAAQADVPRGAQILIYPDIRGLHQFYKELALRFAEAGYTALAIDYFGRSAGLTARDDAFDWQPHVSAMTWPTFKLDVAAATAYLPTLASEPQPIFSVGFCMGGALSLYSSMDDLGLKGVIGFYTGMRRTWIEDKGPLPEAGVHAKIPVLGLYGGADQGIPPDKIQALDENLDKAGVNHSLHIYEGAPHSFFDRTYAQWQEACDDSWRRMFAFIESNK